MEGTTTTSQAKTSSKPTTSNIRTEMFLVQNVTAFTAGLITLATQIDSGGTAVNGRPSGCCWMGQPVVATMKRNGEILSTSGFQGLELVSMQLAIPERELGIGDSWSSNIPPSSSVPVPLEVTYRIVGEETVDGSTCVRIKSTVCTRGEANIERLALRVVADGDLHFDPHAGRMVRNEVTSRMEMYLSRVANGVDESLMTHMKMSMSLEPGSGPAQ